MRRIIYVYVCVCVCVCLASASAEENHPLMQACLETSHQISESLIVARADTIYWKRELDKLKPTAKKEE